MHVENLRRILVLGVCLLVGVGIHSGSITKAQSSLAPGGFLESASSTTVRPQLSASQVAQFLPGRGRFTFPAPYNTEGVRLTNASDCAGGTDCVNSVGYSFWRNINNHVNSSTMLIVITPDKNRGGAGPSLFSYDKVTGATQNLGPLFPPSSPFSYHHGEGWYFSATQPYTLYVNDGPRMLRYDVINRTFSTVFDASLHFGPNRYIWSMHSSDNDTVHSFTLRDTNTYDMLGCGAYRETDLRVFFFPKVNDFDECQVDKSGQFVLIKDNIDGVAGEDNVLEDLQTGTRRILLDQDGAAGHSDNGHGWLVAEDNWSSLPGAVRLFRLDLATGYPAHGRLVDVGSGWGGVSHIAFSDAQAGTPISDQMACRSGSGPNARQNELYCFRLDGSLQALVVAPSMTDMNASGGGDSYTKLPKANLDVTGEYMVWSSNMGGGRNDAFLVRVPKHLLGLSATNPTPTPTPTPTPPPPPPPTSPTPSGTAVLWTSAVNVTLTANGLQKTNGCDGCADAGAVSTQQLASGDGHVEFTATEPTGLRFIGLSAGNQGTSAVEIRHAIRFDAGYAEVRESGMYRSDTPFATGDVFRIAVSGGIVQYSRNGTIFYTSQVAPAYPLLVDTSFSTMNTTVANVVVSFGGSLTPTPPPPPPPPPPTTPYVTWTKLVNAVANSNDLVKTGGCDGCQDAGGISAQQLSASGALEFIVTEATKQRWVGVTNSASARKGEQLAFAWRLRSGFVEVRESGKLRVTTGIAVGNLLRIAIVNGRVEFSKDGALVFRSSARVTQGLNAHAVLVSSGSSVAAATIR